MRKPPRDLSRFKKDLIELMEGDLPEGSEDEILHDMLYNVGQLRSEKLDILELRLLNTAFKELRYALKIFKPYRDVPKAAVFGSARTTTDHASFKIAEDFGRKLAKKNWMIITGGARGIMEAAMVGDGAKNSCGLTLMLPFEQTANPVILGNQKLIFFKYFFTRKLMFLKESQSTVLFPGGFGTFDEGFESFTLVQTGKAKPRPLVLADAPKSGYWAALLEFLKVHMAGERLISPRDLSLIRHCQDMDQAVNEVTHFYENYDSSRFFKDYYLIRLKKRISDAALAQLSVEFKDMFTQGGIERLTDVGEDQRGNPALERITFRFDRASYSRLRELIDRLNDL